MEGELEGELEGDGMLGYHIAKANEEANAAAGVFDRIGTLSLFTRGGIPLPSSVDNLEGKKYVFAVLDKVLDHTCRNFHALQIVLQYRKSIVMGVMPKTRIEFNYNGKGPLAFRNQLHVRNKDAISTAFIHLQHAFGTFLSHFYTMVDGFQGIPSSSVEIILAATNTIFFQLQVSIHLIGELSKISLSFVELPDRDEDDDELLRSTFDKRDSKIIHQNLNRLDIYVSTLVKTYGKPHQFLISWMPFTFGAIGISLFSILLLRHYDVSLQETITTLFSYFIKEPLAVIRDSCLGNNVSIDLKQAELTSYSLERMLGNYVEQIKDVKGPSNASVLEKFFLSFEEQFKNPLKNAVVGNSLQAGAIWAQMIKLLIERGLIMLEHFVGYFNISVAILKPSLAVGLPLYLLNRSRDSQLTKDACTLLLGELEKRITQLNVHLELPHAQPDEDGMYYHGLLVFLVDHIHRLAERSARETREWAWLTSNLVELGRRDADTIRRKQIHSNIKRLRCFGSEHAY